MSLPRSSPRPPVSFGETGYALSGKDSINFNVASARFFASLRWSTLGNCHSPPPISSCSMTLCSSVSRKITSSRPLERKSNAAAAATKSLPMTRILLLYALLFSLYTPLPTLPLD